MSARHVLTVLAVEDLSRSRSFYAGVFGWPVSVDTPVYAELALPDGHRLGLYQRAAFERTTGAPSAASPARGTTSSELYLHVDDLDGVVARLQACGAAPLDPLRPRAWGDEAAYFADPDGNVLAVARPLAPAG